MDLLERRVEKVNAKDTILEEQCNNKGLHALDVEHIPWKKWLFCNPSFHVYKATETYEAKYEGDRDVRGSPPLRSMRAFGQRKDDEDQRWYHGQGTDPVHLDPVRSFAIAIRRYGEVGDHSYGS